MKPQLHVSGLNMLSRCGEQFRRRYIEGEIIPPAVAMIVGTATDAGATKNLQTKIETDSLMPKGVAAEVARDALLLEWDKGVWLDDDERARPLKDLRGEAIDKTVRLANLHASELAPRLKPTHLQRAWTIALDGYPLDLAGTIDVQEGWLSVRDLKTSKKSPSESDADTSTQLTMYAMACMVLDGTMPQFVALDCLVDLKRGPVLKTVASLRKEDDFNPLLARLEIAAEIIEKGAFAPASEADWWCGPKYCGYWATCPYVRKR